MSEHDPRRVRGRDNGLPASSYVPLVEVDPRVADAVLAVLATAGVAAYAAPSTGSAGAYLEVRLPARPVDRVYVDAARRAQARAVLDAELPELAAALPSREDEAFAALVAAYDEEPAQACWPAEEDVPDRRPPPTVVIRPARPPGVAPPGEEEDPQDEGHYEPPPPPPLPRVHPVTRWALAAMGFGLVLLVAPTLLGLEHRTAVDVVGVACVVGAVATLVARMRDRPPTDERGPDDGAVV